MLRALVIFGFLLGMAVCLSPACAAPDENTVHPLGIGLEESYAKPEDIKALGNWPALGRAAIKKLLDGQLVEIEGAGHVSHLERPQEFLGALTKFVATRM